MWYTERKNCVFVAAWIGEEIKATLFITVPRVEDDSCLRWTATSALTIDYVGSAYGLAHQNRSAERVVNIERREEDTMLQTY